MKPKHPVQIEIETKIRSQHKEQSTADAYWGWVKRYFGFSRVRNTDFGPRNGGAKR